MIRLLIVDDEKVVQDFLYHLFTSDTKIQVVGVASSGEQAIEYAKTLEPDVITMDVHMPGMDGYETTRKIMMNSPTPIVIVSESMTIREEVNVFRSLEAGALAVIHRPSAGDDPESEMSRKELIQTVKVMSNVRIRRRSDLTRKEEEGASIMTNPSQNFQSRVEIVAIGASTGGPLALQKILSMLPHNLPVPVLIVQHISTGFTKSLKEWLSITSGIMLKIAEEGELLSPGIGYLAPDHFNMGITRGMRIKLYRKPEGIEVDTSINQLFHSVSQVAGLNAMGVLLTGIGIDGTESLKAMKENGALTIVQNQSSSLVFDMPGEALRIGAADLSLSPEEIAEIISKCGIKN
jgi:two-component system chemotaxis response regulator CheB